MSIRKNIKQAREIAVSNAIKKGLEENRLEISSLDEILNKPYEVEAVLTYEGDRRILILPVDNKGKLEKKIITAVESNLSKYDTEKRKIEDYIAFQINTKRKLPKSIYFSVGDLSFKLDIIDEEFNLDSLHQIENKRTNNFKSLPESEYYRPNVVKDFEFDLNSDTKSSKKYNLIVLRRNVSGYFPGFKVPFSFIYKEDEIKARRVCSSKENTKVGENAGNYISKGITKLFKKYPELKEADKLRIKVKSPGQVYEIVRAD